jgi:iron complex outermembrane recepter protein
MKKNILVTASAAAMSLAIGTAGAQDVASTTEEVIVVGIRSALESAEERKINSPVILDGISADDIGALPDVSISESLTRIVGVTSNDTARGSDQVALRGLGPDFVSTQYNGRILPTADGVNRRVGLAGLPSEGLASAYAQKTPEASTIEGGVAGILLLEAIRPLETRRRGLTVVARALREDLSEDMEQLPEARPYGARGELTYVDRIRPNLGVAVTFSALREGNYSAGTQLENWRLGAGARADLNGDGTGDVLPTNAGPIGNTFNTDRQTALGMIQWEPTDDIRLSLDGIWSQDEYRNTTRRLFALNLFDGALDAATSSTVENDTVTAFSGASALYRGVVNFGRAVDRTYGMGLNAEIDFSERLEGSFDLSWFNAGRDRFTPIVNYEVDGATAAAQRQTFSYDITDRSNPRFTFNQLSADAFALQQINTTKQDSEDDIVAARADFTYALEQSFVRELEFGGRVDRRLHSQRVDNIQYTWANLAARPDLDGSMLATTRNAWGPRATNFGGASATAAMPFFDGPALLDLGLNSAGVLANDQFANDIGAGAEIDELTYALYAQGNFQFDRLSGNVGLRWVQTESESRGQAGTNASNVIDQEFENTYGYLLPSLNLRYRIIDNLFIRGAVARTMSRPLFEQLSVGSATDLSGGSTGAVTISRGNPNLKPFTADGVDVGIEWYPSEASSFAFAVYNKDVTNFTRSQTRPGEIALADGTVVPATITEFINDPEERYFRGFELQARQDFNFLPGAWRNLGVQSSYNHNKTDARETFTSLAGPAGVGTTVEVLPINLSEDVFNGQIYYDGPKLQVRLAYRYSSGYSRRFSNGYQYQPEGQWDLNGSYALLPNVRLIGTVTNLLGTEQHRLTADSRDLGNDVILQNRSYLGRNFAIGLRASF